MRSYLYIRLNILTLSIILLIGCDNSDDHALNPNISRSLSGKILCNNPVNGYFSDVRVILIPDSIQNYSNYAGEFYFDNVASELCTLFFVYPGYDTTITLSEIQAGENNLEPKYLNEAPPRLVKSFSGGRSNNSVGLGWITETETNNQGFEIQKSDGGEFTTVAFVEGAGTSTEPRTYSISISAAPSDKYFRLKQISFDNTYKYSVTIKIE